MNTQLAKRRTQVVNGKRYVLIEERELLKLERQAAKAGKAPLPDYPDADAKGNRPAIEFAQVSIARNIITRRQAVGLTQEELAKLAGLRQETISRLESGKHSPTLRTVEKIDRVLQTHKSKKGR